MTGAPLFRRIEPRRDLTPREQELLAHARAHQPVKVIADLMGTKPNTVKTQVKRILAKIRKAGGQARTLRDALAKGLVVLALCAAPASVGAQDLPAVPEVELPALGETVALEASDRAPWAGMLVRDEDLFALQSQVMTLQLRLELAGTMLGEALAGRASLLATADAACAERIELRTTLWQERQAELAAALEAARSREGARWYEILGFTALGLVVGALIALPVGWALGAQ